MPQYRKRPLNCVHERFSYQSTQNNVSVQVKRLNEDEKYTLFGQRSVWLYDTKSNQPIYPLYISIHNLSDTTYEISPESIDLELTPYTNIAHCLKTNSFGRGAKTFAIGSSILLATAIPAVAVAIANSKAPNGPLAPKKGSAFEFAITAEFFGTLFSTLFVTLRSAWVNTKIKHDLKEKTLHSTKLIYPGQQFDTLVFVGHANYQDNFIIELDDSDNIKNSLTFTVADL